jgi:hypothetical protein
MTATPGTFYGPSDLDAFQYLGHTHEFYNPKYRYLQPGFGRDDRTLPMLTCPECKAFAKDHLGFDPDPTKVAQTTDETAYMERFTREGSMETQLAMREGFKAIGELLVQQQKAKTTK